MDILKKTIFAALVVILMASGAHAQETDFGIKGGMNVAMLGKAGYGARVGYHLGPTVEFVTTPFFSIQTELIYSLQGASVDPTQRIFLNYHYLNLPLLAKMYFYEDAYFELGVQYGFLMKAVEKNDLYKEDKTDQVNRNDFALAIGLGYLLNERFLFNLRFNLGITNTNSQKVAYEFRYTNRVMQISAGYIF